MARVHSFDPNALVEIGLETAWGTTATTGFVRVYPMVEPGDTMAQIRSTITPVRTYADGGARTSYDYGREYVQGSVTMWPSYNSPAFPIMLREFHGMNASALGTASEGPDGQIPTGTPSGYRTHLFLPYPWTNSATAGYEGGVGKGITIRVWKSATDAGVMDRYVGCLITSMVWEQPENQPPKVTFNFIGKVVSRLSPVSGESGTKSTVPTNLVLMKYRDLSSRPLGTTVNSPCLIKSKLNQTNTLNLKSFTIRFDAKLEQAPAFATAPDSSFKPFHTDQWGCTAQFDTMLEQNYGDADKPHTEYLASTETAIRIRYSSTTNAFGTGDGAGAIPFAFDIQIPRGIWTLSKPNVSDFTATPHRLEFEARGTVTGDLAATRHAGTAEYAPAPWLLQLIHTQDTSF